MRGRLVGQRRMLAAPATACFKHREQITGVVEQGGRRRRKQAGEKITGEQGTTKRRKMEKEKIIRGLEGQKSQLQKDSLKTQSKCLYIQLFSFHSNLSSILGRGRVRGDCLPTVYLAQREDKVEG